jgi:hypothetical protein
MTVAATKAVSSTDKIIEKVEAKAGVSDLVSVALFSGVGLLVSLAIVILDQLTPGEWF